MSAVNEGAAVVDRSTREQVVAHAAAVDRERAFPSASLAVLGTAKLLGLGCPPGTEGPAAG